MVYREVAPGTEPGASRPVKGAFERLEPDEVKVSSPVLRGRGGGNAASLPDVCPESYRLLAGGSPVAVRVRQPRSRQPVLLPKEPPQPQGGFVFGQGVKILQLQSMS